MTSHIGVRRQLAVAATSALLAACSPGAPSVPPTAASPEMSPDRSARPVIGAKPSNGIFLQSLPATAPPIAGGRRETIGGDRPVTLYIPDAQRPVPLLILLHAFGGSGQWQEDYWRIGGVAASHGIAFLHPDGTVSKRGPRFWNATEACCDYDRTGVDDSTYLQGLIAEAEAVAAIDPRRVFVVGHSNGGFMSYRMACEHAAEVAAIVAFGAATFRARSDCRPTEPVAVLHIHGAADRTISYGGNPGIPGAQGSTEMWAGYDGCEPKLTVTGQRVDVAADIDGPDGPAEAIVSVAQGCAPGGHVELWTIPGADHFPDLSRTFADLVVGFLLAHPKP